MFLGGWFLVRHVSIKVLWWLAFSIEISIPFSFVPSSCRGSICCSVSFGEDLGDNVRLRSPKKLKTFIEVP